MSFQVCSKHELGGYPSDRPGSSGWVGGSHPTQHDGQDLRPEPNVTGSNLRPFRGASVSRGLQDRVGEARLLPEHSGQVCSEQQSPWSPLRVPGDSPKRRESRIASSLYSHRNYRVNFYAITLLLWRLAPVIFCNYTFATRLLLCALVTFNFECN